MTKNYSFFSPASDGAYILSKVLKSLSLEKLILRLNPIGSDGAASIFSVLEFLPITNLDMAGCSLDKTITKLFMQLVVQNKKLWFIDLSNNILGQVSSLCFFFFFVGVFIINFYEFQEFGKHLLKVVGFNKTLKSINLRNAGLSLEMCQQFQEILKQNHLNMK